MNRSYHGHLGACVVALALAGCASVAQRPDSPLPEPPPWNSIEMMWLETEIVRADSPGSGRPVTHRSQGYADCVAGSVRSRA